MNIKTQLLQYQEEMEDLEKKAQRIKGSLDVEYSKLREELGESAKTPNDKLVQKAQTLLEDLDAGISEMSDRLKKLMGEIQDKYQELEEQEETEGE